MSNAINPNERGAPLKRLPWYQTLAYLFFGDINPAPNARGGILNSYRPAPWGFTVVFLFCVGMMVLIWLDGNIKVHEGAYVPDLQPVASTPSHGGV